MKKLKVFIFALMALFTLNLTVNAKDVSTYADLKSCLENDTDATCKLTGSVTPLESDVKTINVTGTKTLDLNTYTLTMLDSIYVENGAKLVVNGGGKITTNAVQILMYVKAGGTFEVDNAEIIATKSYGRAVYIKGDAGDVKTHVTIGKNAKLSANYTLMLAYSDADSTKSNGVTVDIYGSLIGLVGNDGWEYGGEAIYVNGNIRNANEKSSVINIYDGSVLEGKNVTSIYAAGYAIWNIGAATITGNEALSIKAGKFMIDGATLKAVGEFVKPEEVVANTNANEPSGAAVSVTTNSSHDGNIELTLKNVKVTSEKGYAFFEKTTAGTTTQIDKLVIESGSFTGVKGDIYTGNSFTKFIKSGEFSTEPNIAWVADGHSIAKIDNSFHVGPTRFIEVEPVEGGEVTTDLIKTIAGKNVGLTVEAEEGYYVKSIKVVNARDKEEYIDLGTDLYFIMPDYDVIVEAEFAEYLNKEGNIVEVESELEIDNTIESDLKEEIEEVIVETSVLEAIDFDKFEMDNAGLVEVKLVSKLTDIKEKDGKVSLVFDIKPIYSIDGDEQGVLDNEYLNGEKIKIKLPVPESVKDTHAKVTHKSGDKVVSELEVEVVVEDDKKYVVIEPTSFSEFTIDFYTPVEANNPQTFDTTTTMIITLIASFVVLTTAVVIFKKRNN